MCELIKSLVGQCAPLFDLPYCWRTNICNKGRFLLGARCDAVINARAKYMCTNTRICSDALRCFYFIVILVWLRPLPAQLLWFSILFGFWIGVGAKMRMRKSSDFALFRLFAAPFDFYFSPLLFNPISKQNEIHPIYSLSRAYYIHSSRCIYINICIYIYI